MASKFTIPRRPLNWLITGCSSGIGLAMARAVHASPAGHTLIATSRDPSRTPDLVSELTSSNPKNRWVPLDVDHPTAASDLIASLEAEGIEVDVLVNNAGWAILQAAEHFTDDEVRAQFETVFFGPYRLTRAVLPGMRRRRFGVVVNVSSAAALAGRESMSAYGAAKAAMDTLTMIMANEIAPFNIRTLTVPLGSFRTNMGSQVRTGSVPLAEDYKDSMTDKILHSVNSNMVLDGDPMKAAKVIYEVIMGEGVGEGRESEQVLPLGIEMERCVKFARDRLDRSWDAFGDIALNVRCEGDAPRPELPGTGSQR